MIKEVLLLFSKITRSNGPSFIMASYHSQCDSYFVESHEDQEKRFREELKEYDRRQKWQTQLAIAEDLSQLTSCEYGDDILEHMETMEVKRLDA